MALISAAVLLAKRADELSVGIESREVEDELVSRAAKVAAHPCGDHELPLGIRGRTPFTLGSAPHWSCA